jgi:hypothetical protein
MSGAGNNRGRCGACERARASLDDWLDGLLDHEAAGRLESHLAECSSCAAWFEQHRTISVNLAALGQAAERIAGKPERTEDGGADDGLALAGRVRRLIRLRSWIAVAAVLVIFVGAGLFMASSRHQTKNAPHLPERKAQITVAENDNTFSVTCPEGRMVVPIASSNPRIHIVWLYDEMLPAKPAEDIRTQGDDQ